ncbi:MAG: hypothetical protein ABI538_05370 [Pseudoxanthomonas sp.]
MAIDNGSESKAETGVGAGDPGIGVDTPRASLIKVSYNADGSPWVDTAMVGVYAGDRLLWHTASHEQRAFKLVFAEDFPVDEGSGQTATGAPSTEGGRQSKYGSAAQGRTFTSSPQQIAEVTIRSNAKPGVYEYQVQAGGIKGVPGIVFAGGVIIRPTGPRPLT